MRQYVPEEQLWTEFNGTLDFQYDHSVYWPALQKLCKERREEHRQRWVQGGQLIGEHEDYLCGHSPAGAGGGPSAPPANGDDKTEAAQATTEVPAPVAEAEGKAAQESTEKA